MKIYKGAKNLTDFVPENIIPNSPKTGKRKIIIVKNTGLAGVIADMAVSEPKVVLRICTNPVWKDPKVCLAG